MILIIDRNKKQRTSISEMFHYMGILSYHVAPEEAFAKVTLGYRAILITNPLSSPDINDYILNLKKYAGRIPIFLLYENAEIIDSVPAADGVFDVHIYSSTLVNEIIKYQEKHSLPSLGKYLLAGLDAGCDIPKPRFLSHPIPLTKTETMIVRYLTVTYPNCVNAEDILRHSLKPGKEADISVIRAHISSINKKFRDLRGRPLIISFPGHGYLIETPEIIEKYKHESNT